jgi:hypothetical protein
MKEIKEIARITAVDVVDMVKAIRNNGKLDMEKYGEKWITPENERDFPLIFERNYNEYPGKTPEQFRQHFSELLNQLITICKAKYEHPEKIGNFQWAIHFNQYLNNGMGINSNLSQDQLQFMYKRMDEYCATSEENFILALTHRPLPSYFEPIRWVKLNRNKKPNQYTLRAFLESVTNEKTVRKKDVERCFADQYGNMIILNKPKRDDNYKYHLKKFKKMIQ